MRREKLLATVVIGFIVILNLNAENWQQWRGPAFNGSSPEKNLPTNWAIPDKNIIWSTPMPGQSAATPAIFNNHIFVTSADPKKDLYLLCIDNSNGSIRWQRKVSTGDITVNQNNMASPSPVTDGKIVISLFGTGDLAAFDFNGKELWKKNLAEEYGKFALMYLYSASPLLYNGKLYIQVMQRDNPRAYPHSKDDKPARESFLLCLEPTTGKTLWRHIRPTDAVNESMESYATPIPHHGKNGLEILLVGGDYVTGHDPETGKELWRSAGLNPRQTEMQRSWFRVVPSPVVADGIIVACGPKGQPVIGIKEGGSGLITDTHRAWTCKDATSDWATPLFYQNKLYVLDGGRRILTCLNPKTGEKIWSGQLPVSERIWSSPTGADNKIYCMSEKGTVIVCEAGDEFKVLAVNTLDEHLTRASVAVANGRIYLRTAKYLHCIGFK